ncbi:ABC-type uncharacterized transport system, substrate-binding protein [Mariprofundus ferrinatatus]|uniref:ABC-type uncharacterized transport system, substrate-binding protein n=1 Tax=Mariprofundus ferrinatatus TaxID=1921087 RepID=A0A2K8L959_9PROT|nr:ABC transporter substrate binding protein [Mariprofundus ferrinatatus]ATX82789.1 ABC-type uncharacterized transport system, substrate-binding protein [Mariprofundus ferrinatatus]
MITRTALAFSLAILFSSPAMAAKCLYISSYHQGYEWNDGIERGIEAALKERCELDRFYLDTKRNKSEAFGKAMALKAKTYIEESNPDILIAADDNASRYLIEPYFRDAEIPVVFCGINYSVEPYGYPYSNATGMIEISPVRPLLKYVKNSLPRLGKGTFLAADVISQYKEFELNREVYESSGIRLTPVFAKNMEEWIAAYRNAQDQADFVIIGNNAGIEDWDDERATKLVVEEGGLLSVTNYDWMSRYALLSVTKLAEEQGDWAARTAIAVLEGTEISTIPIIVNRRWRLLINTSLMEKSNIRLPQAIITKAIRISL